MPPFPTKAWICTICGYIHYSDEPPEECPQCGAPRDMFEPYIEEVPEPTVPIARQAHRVVIVGAGIAGVSAAEALHKAAAHSEILLISNENRLPYYRLNLTRYLAGEVSGEQLLLHPSDWYTQHGVELRLNTALQSIDLQQKMLTLSDNRRVPFDRLILTVGSSPFVPPFPGVELNNVTTLRTPENADAILQASRGGKKCVCIGGGLIGLETAAALAKHGADVTVLESLPWLLPRQLNQAAGRMLEQQMGALHVARRTSVKTSALVGDDRVRGVQLDDGSVIPADLVVISAGCAPTWAPHARPGCRSTTASLSMMPCAPLTPMSLLQEM